MGTNNAIKNLEVHHVATLTDLKGRIVRCDSAISKLGTDMRSCFDSIRQLNQQQQEVSNRIMDRMNGLEQQVLRVAWPGVKGELEQPVLRVAWPGVKGELEQQVLGVAWPGVKGELEQQVLRVAWPGVKGELEQQVLRVAWPGVKGELEQQVLRVAWPGVKRELEQQVLRVAWPGVKGELEQQVLGVTWPVVKRGLALSVIIIMIKRICIAPINHIGWEYRALCSGTNNTHMHEHTHTHTHMCVHALEFVHAPIESHDFLFQLIAINNQVERNSGESRMKLTHLEGDTNTQMSMIDAKTRQLVDEVKTMVTTMHTTIDADRDRMEQRILSMIEKNGASKDLLIVSTV